MRNLINFIKGIVIGIATLVPGVSGGTMAILLNVYDDLIHSISSFFKDWKKHTIFLVEIGLGALLAFVLFGNLIKLALRNFPMQVGFFFLGVICGGIPVMYKKATSTKGTYKDLIFLVLGFLLVLLMSKDPTAVTTIATQGGLVSTIFLLIAGFIIAIALILPGISGSFMLLSLGLYDVTIDAITKFNIPFLIPLGIGTAIGVITTTRTIEKLFEKHHRKTYMLILGFVAGSVIPVFPGIPKGIPSMITSILAVIIGFIIIILIGKKSLEVE